MTTGEQAVFSQRLRMAKDCRSAQAKISQLFIDQQLKKNLLAPSFGVYSGDKDRRKPEAPPYQVPPSKALSQPAPLVRHILPGSRRVLVSGLWRASFSGFGVFFMSVLRLGPLRLSRTNIHGDPNRDVPTPSRRVSPTHATRPRSAQTRSDLRGAQHQSPDELSREHRHGFLVHQPLRGM